MPDPVPRDVRSAPGSGAGDEPAAVSGQPESEENAAAEEVPRDERTGLPLTQRVSRAAAKARANDARMRGSATAADLRSADVLTDVRAALATFEDEARAVLESIGMKADSTVRWLNEEAPFYWQNASRTANDKMAAARIALDICKQRSVAGHRPSCIEEKQALARSKERERFCHDQRSIVRSHAHNLRHEVDEAKTRLVMLQRWLDGDLPKLQARLHRLAVAIAAYAATPPVRAGDTAPREAARDAPSETVEDTSSEAAEASSHSVGSHSVPPQTTPEETT